MNARIVWLASYPKSGNTWVRAIVTALSVHSHLFDVNQLGSNAQPFVVAGSIGHLGLDSRWLSFDENDQLRTALIRSSLGSTGEDIPPPSLRKTHEVWRPGLEDSEPFPPDVTRAAVLVVRDPRDVACSFAPFFGIDLDDAIKTMGSAPKMGRGQPVQSLAPQPWGSWSDHVRSWLAPEVPFPVYLVRYEDLRADPVATIEPVFEAIGLGCTREELEAALAQTSFDRLRESEAQTGFREANAVAPAFFRAGRSGGWREELSVSQIAAIEADHGDAMTEHGYELVTTETNRRALGESRGSLRRRGDASWTSLPAHLGLDVHVAAIPDELYDAIRPLPGLQTTSQAARVQFPGGNALLVENGRDVTVQWNHDPTEGDVDLSWLVQGWAVTLASLQRGNLSLHASTVQIGDEVVALAGHQGAGKSTTAMGLRARGHRLLVDDTTVIEFRDEGGAWTTPYARNVHLLRDAADALGVNVDVLQPLAGRLGKVAFRAEDPPTEPHRIDRIVVLTRPVAATKVTLTEVRGVDRIETLRQHVARLGLAPAILGQPAFFALVAKLADAVPVQLLRRPPDNWSLDAVLDVIEAGRPETEPSAG